MKIDMQQLHKDIISLKRDIILIKNILVEEGCLTEQAKKDLAEARATPEEEYLNQEAIEKEFLE